MCGQAKGNDVELGLIDISGEVDTDGGVAHGSLLVRISDAVSGPNPHSVAAFKDEAIAAMGVDSFVDAVAVSALFQLMNRVANGTGTPLDPFMAEPGRRLGAEVGADRFLSSDDTP